LVDENGTEMVIGADWNGLAMQTRTRWERKGNRVIDTPQLVRSVDDGIPFLLNSLDKPYDYTGLLGMPIVLAGRFWFHKRWKNVFASRRALFCSESAALMFKYVGYPMANLLDPSSTDPALLRHWQRQVVDHEEAVSS